MALNCGWAVGRVVLALGKESLQFQPHGIVVSARWTCSCCFVHLVVAGLNI